MANTTGKKFAGRQKGTPNKRTQMLIERAKEKGADPAEFLMDYVIGDMRALGYEDRLVARQRDYELAVQEYEEKKATSKAPGKLKAPEPLRDLTEAEKKELNLIPYDERKDAAKELMPYLYGKRKPIDSDGNDANDFLSDILEAIDANK